MKNNNKAGLIKTINTPHNINIDSAKLLSRLIMGLVLSSLTLIAPPLYARFDCPASWDDAKVFIDDPNPPPEPGTPELSIAGIKRFVDQNSITNIEDLLSALPPSMQKNYALVEETRTDSTASLEHPRLLLFGSDARFLMAMGSDPDAPDREVLDMG